MATAFACFPGHSYEKENTYIIHRRLFSGLCVAIFVTLPWPSQRLCCISKEDANFLGETSLFSNTVCASYLQGLF